MLGRWYATRMTTADGKANVYSSWMLHKTLGVYQMLYYMVMK